jgi:hypothetical protein
MKIFVHGFWDGFLDKTNPVNISFFLNLFKIVFNEEIEISTFEKSNILLESIFDSKTYIFDKKWDYTFLFSGESRLNPYHEHYSCVLYGEKNHNNIINVPLFIPNVYCSNLIEKFIKQKNITHIPSKNICAIISNPSGNERNTFLNELEKTLKIDYGGCYKTNIKKFDDIYNSEKFINRVSEYKFIISMENSRGETYITEKILHGFSSGSIPIYWGSTQVCDYFNKDRFLNLSENSLTSNIIQQIHEIINDDTKFLEFINKPIFNNNKLDRDINKIAGDIKNLIFDKKINLIQQTFIISSIEFEPERYERLNTMFSNIGLNKYNLSFICPTYKQTITDEIMNKHVKYNLVKRLRRIGMKKAEISLFLNYKEVLETIVKNYSDGLFLIFESDVFCDNNFDINKLNRFVQNFSNNKNSWDLIHIGKGGENEYFGKPYCDCIMPYRDKPNNLPNMYIEDITTPNDEFRLIRKFHTRCTDSFLWNFKGIVKFLNYMNENLYYDAPFDYYMTNFFENNVGFKHYWSIDTFFIQGSNYGLDKSTIQNDML